ncbi:FkbM family methyltransferase [Rhodocytophaga rosea]|uniref:FkbM family methyltransferase n=1 Tax=Rhodocytophaga rosea TaxID=2704465 RepID=A0A6C0GML3_9BACT|nr:FkbM family methyltransferase [Rhodocytophaga rosea]QHT68842.1 FkbM family methyltransferase [Rhodocytophaga rosea]
MRRVKILLYWIFRARFNVSLPELLQFLKKPTVKNIGSRYIKNITKTDGYEISFEPIPDKLYWPGNFPVEGIYQVTAETFDKDDWHFYQKQHTEIEEGEILLDIGTAEGLFPLSVIQKCKQVFLVEPNKYFFAALQRTFRNYQDKVVLIHSAVGNKDDIISLQGESLSGQISDDLSSGDTVEIHKIDHLIAGHRITYLKADIEGFEYEMLKGAAAIIKENKPKIAITTYHPQNNAEEIISLIRSYVPEYKYYVKGIYDVECKPVMIHLWC